MIFDYPDRQDQRRHGPAGYAAYESYRPWLRDEFEFRCVYCLKRETWGQVTSEFELDHFEPQSLSPQLALDYLNLVYACRRCNLVKRDRRSRIHSDYCGRPAPLHFPTDHCDHTIATRND